MEFIDVIKARRSCRKYTSETVPASVIEQALDHALIAPNSSNMQLWKFYWVHSPENKKSLAEACSINRRPQRLKSSLSSWLTGLHGKLIAI